MEMPTVVMMQKILMLNPKQRQLKTVMTPRRMTNMLVSLRILLSSSFSTPPPLLPQFSEHFLFCCGCRMNFRRGHNKVPETSLDVKSFKTKKLPFDYFYL